MKKITLALILNLVCCMSCSNEKTEPSPDKTNIGKAEEEAYQFILARLTKDLKDRFSSNLTERDRITPEESTESVKIGIPGSMGYIFYKGNGKFLKGDVNNDKKIDLIISAGMLDVNTPEKNLYFVFLQDETGYTYFDAFKADDIVADFCDKNQIKMGEFNIQTIDGGLLVGKLRFHKGNEKVYNDYSLNIEKACYKLNVKDKKLELVSQTNLK